MKIIDSILKNNPCYNSGRKINVKGLMLHSVGCPQPSAMVFVKNWNKATFNNACVHAFIDANTGDVYKCLPWNHRGWHGGGSSNNTHIGVEMCEPSCIKYVSGSKFTCTDKAKAKKSVKIAYESAVELFAMLCKEFGLDPLKDILSHAEGHKKGIASNHGDPEHLWNQLDCGYTMDGFRADVKKAMGIVTDVEKPSFVNYKVKVNASVLNVRNGAGTAHKINTTVRKGEVYTIVDEENGWGKLKSGAGWICLSYTKRL